MRTPVVLFCFNRSIELKQVLTAIRKSKFSEDRLYYVFVDGPRDEKDIADIDAVCTLLDEFKRSGFNVIITNREQNIGLRRNIVNGLDEIFLKCGSAIILEDDIVVGENFFEYMDSRLIKYSQYHKISAVNAWCSRNLPFQSTYRSTIFRCWGWGTWAEIWNQYRRDVSLYYDRPKWLMRITFDNLFTEDFSQQMLHNLQGKKDTWAVYFSHLIYRNRYHCISPTISLTKNIGFENPTNTFMKIKQWEPCGKTPTYDLVHSSWLIRMVMLAYHLKNKVTTKIRSIYNAKFN